MHEPWQLRVQGKSRWPAGARRRSRSRPSAAHAPSPLPLHTSRRSRCRAATPARVVGHLGRPRLPATRSHTRISSQGKKEGFGASVVIAVTCPDHCREHWLISNSRAYRYRRGRPAEPSALAPIDGAHYVVVRAHKQCFGRSGTLVRVRPPRRVPQH